MKTTFLINFSICLGLLFSGNLVADDDNIEFKIKAGYLYNFTKFITWPKLNEPTFNLCILGDDPFGATIDPIEQKSAFSHSIKVVRLNESTLLSAPTLKSNCQILYVSSTKHHKSIVEKVKASPSKAETLLVGEGEDFATEGGMIGFINRNGKIKLQINVQSVKQTGLQISAKLLEIAELINVENHD